MSRNSLRAATFALLAAGAIGAAWPTPKSEDWADSPEAYFLTPEEIVEWKALDKAGRDAFQQRYWLKRDPTPGTEKNEFKDLVLARIKVADERFGIEKTPGSRTSRGFVFIVLGSPARVRDEHAASPDAPRFPAQAVGALEGNETITHWIYDRERTPRVLEAIELPSLEVEIIVEPSRHSDSLHSPGLMKDLREKLARKSVVNKDLVPGSAETSAPAPAAALPRVVLDAALRPMLEKAPLASRTGSTVFGDAVLWRDSGQPETLVWFYLPPAAPGTRRSLHGIVRKENGGEEVATLSEPVGGSDAFSTADPGEVVLRRLALPPGSYDAAFAVTEGAGKEVASAAVKISVPDITSGFVVSPIVLTRSPGNRSPGDDGAPFAVGQAVLPPRADATFSASESLWFFFELANAPDPAKVTVELRMRRGADAVSSKPAFPAGPAALGPGRSLCGFELPLSGLSPGDYRIYAIVRDGVAPPDQAVTRSADFRVRP